MLATAALALAAVATQAQRDTGEIPDEVFFENVEVNVVNLDVYVTGRDGQPLTGLTRQDFEILEDGRPVTVSNFYAVRDGRPADAAPAALPVPGAPAPALLDDDAGAPEDQQLHLIVFVDNLFLGPSSRNRTLREVQHFLQGIGPDARVMLVSFERSVTIRQAFTTDPRLVGRALEGVLELAALGSSRETDRRQVLDRVLQSRDLADAHAAIEFWAEATENDVHNSIRALKNLVATLSGLPGRKALLYISDGIPMTAGEELFFLADTRHGKATTGQLRALRYRARRQFQELIAQASSSRVSFYTVDARGLAAHGSLSAEHGGSSAGGSLLEVDTMGDANRQEPLLLMAEETGGLALVNSNNIRGALERMATDFTTYYSLGYLPAHFGDGRYHELEVRLPHHPGATVRHRQGYRDKTIDARVADATLGALLYGAVKNPLGITVSTGRPIPSEHGNYLVPVEVKVPLERLTFLPRDNVQVGRVRVAVVAADRDGDTSPPGQQVAPIEIPLAEFAAARRQSWTYSAQLLMRPGLNRVAIGVRDEISGEHAYTRTTIDVGS
jgi:VWFA-related protein